MTSKSLGHLLSTVEASGCSTEIQWRRCGRVWSIIALSSAVLPPVGHRSRSFCSMSAAEVVTSVSSNLAQIQVDSTSNYTSSTQLYYQVKVNKGICIQRSFCSAHEELRVGHGSHSFTCNSINACLYPVSIHQMEPP